MPISFIAFGHIIIAVSCLIIYLDSESLILEVLGIVLLIIGYLLFWFFEIYFLKQKIKIIFNNRKNDTILNALENDEVLKVKLSKLDKKETIFKEFSLDELNKILKTIDPALVNDISVLLGNFDLKKILSETIYSD